MIACQVPGCMEMAAFMVRLITPAGVSYLCEDHAAMIPAANVKRKLGIA